MLPAEISRIGSTATAPAWLRLALDRAWAGRTHVVLHPLGFCCIPVRRSVDGGVCVHLWADWFEAERPTTSAIHCHSWDLHSTVLAGRLRNHVLRVLSAAGATHRVFEIHSGDGEDRVDLTPALVSWRRVTTGIYTGGQSYELPAGTFHLTEIAEATTATIVLATTRRHHGDLSLGPIDGASHRIRRRLATPDQAARAAGEVARLLGCDLPPAAGRAEAHG